MLEAELRAAQNELEAQVVDKFHFINIQWENIFVWIYFRP